MNLYHYKKLNDFFAFDWLNLPESIKEKISAKIRQMYGWNISHNDVESIFKCLVARDIEIPMPYIKIKNEEAVDGIFPVKVYDKSQQCWKIEYRHISYPQRKAYIVYFYVPNKNKYRMISGYSYIFTDFESDAVMYNFNKALEKCVNHAIYFLLRYVCFGFNEYEENAVESKKRFLKRIENYDWTKKGTVTFKKFDFMENPRNTECTALCPDWRLRNVIEKYQLSSETNQQFIDWIAGGCKGSINKKAAAKLTEENIETVKSAIEFEELTRVNIIDFYHGFQENLFSKLKPGSIFVCNNINAKYVVIKVGNQDHEKVIAYAKLGTSIDGDGFIKTKNILFGISKDSIEDCWSALYDINKLHRKKKILRNVEILKI